MRNNSILQCGNNNYVSMDNITELTKVMVFDDRFIHLTKYLKEYCYPEFHTGDEYIYVQ